MIGYRVKTEFLRQEGTIKYWQQK